MAQSEPKKPTACLALADGTVFYGHGFGATGETAAELCFNTAMTGYQEIMTDPSYAGQVVTFTFPHIGNTGVTPEDDETADPVSAGMIVKWDPTTPSNWRSTQELGPWLAARGRIGMGGVDTRRLTRAIRQQGAPHVALAHNPDGVFDIAALVQKARDFSGLVGLDLAKDVTCAQSYHWNEMRWAWPEGYAPQTDPKYKVVAIDYGAKRSMNHGFTVDSQTLPAGVVETHISLFDGSNCGIRMQDRPVFGVQYHPEASPGPQDSYYLFERFAEAMAARAA